MFGHMIVSRVLRGYCCQKQMLLIWYRTEGSKCSAFRAKNFFLPSQLFIHTQNNEYIGYRLLIITQAMKFQNNFGCYSREVKAAFFVFCCGIYFTHTLISIYSLVLKVSSQFVCVCFLGELRMGNLYHRRYYQRPGTEKLLYHVSLS